MQTWVFVDMFERSKEIRLQYRNFKVYYQDKNVYPSAIPACSVFGGCHALLEGAWGPESVHVILRLFYLVSSQHLLHE